MRSAWIRTITLHRQLAYITSVFILPGVRSQTIGAIVLGLPATRELSMYLVLVVTRL